MSLCLCKYLAKCQVLCKGFIYLKLYLFALIYSLFMLVKIDQENVYAS